MRWFARNGLRILMYHKVSPTKRDELTVTCAQLDTQMRWLQEEGFSFVTGSQVIAEARGNSALPRNSVLVTFDDAYFDTFDLAYPLLRRLGIPAVVFVPTAFIGGASTWDAEPQPLMTETQLRQLAGGGWEVGLHSHRHSNYANLWPAEIASDLRACVERSKEAALPTIPAFAYPYGGRPRAAKNRRQMQSELSTVGFQIAFRIGNRVSRLPLRDAYEINRLGVRGDKDLGFFRRQLWWGRWF